MVAGHGIGVAVEGGAELVAAAAGVVGADGPDDPGQHGSGGVYGEPGWA